MANIELKLTQAAYDGVGVTYRGDNANLLLNLVSIAPGALAGVTGQPSDVGSYTFDGSNLRLNFTDGSYDQLNGLVLSSPGALKGTATASGAILAVPNLGSAEESGQYKFSYDLSGPTPVVQLISSTTNTLTLKTQVPAGSPDYDPVLGNGSLQIKGAITIDAAGHLGGTLTSVTFTADKLLTAASLTGALQLSGDNVLEDATNPLDVKGTVDAANLQFADGSYIKAGGLGVHLDSSTLQGSLTAAAGDLPGDDTVSIELPATLTQAFAFNTGAGNDTITLAGGGNFLNVLAGAGNDTITVLSAHHQIDGGAGNDTVVYTGARADYTVTTTAAGIDVASAGGVDHLSSVERLEFRGGAVSETVALDISGNAGQAYRLYQAAFDRAPDSKGLGYWIGVLDQGSSLKDMAAGFINSAEFATLYGANPSNGDFVGKLYDNVLHRAYDKAGFDYWVDVLNHGESRAQVLTNFGESPENQAQVIGSIQHGITFTPYHG